MIWWWLQAPQTASLLGDVDNFVLPGGMQKLAEQVVGKSAVSKAKRQQKEIRGLQQTAATASDVPRTDLWTTPPKHVDAVTKETLNQILAELKTRFGEWRGWKANGCKIVSWKNENINLQDPNYKGVLGLSQEELQYVKGVFMWPVVSCAKMSELAGARKLLGSKVPSLAAVARVPGIQRGSGIAKKSGGAQFLGLVTNSGKTINAAHRKTMNAAKKSHIGKTMSAAYAKFTKGDPESGIKRAQLFAATKVKVEPIECDGFHYDSKKAEPLSAEVKKICQSALGERTATDSPHALKIPVVFKVTKCAKQEKCDVKIAGWGMFKDWRSQQQQKNDKLSQKYDKVCGELSVPTIKILKSIIPLSESRKQSIADTKKQNTMCWSFRNAGWDSTVRDTIAKFRFKIARCLENQYACE